MSCQCCHVTVEYSSINSSCRSVQVSTYLTECCIASYRTCAQCMHACMVTSIEFSNASNTACAKQGFWVIFLPQMATCTKSFMRACFRACPPLKLCPAADETPNKIHSSPDKCQCPVSPSNSGMQRKICLPVCRHKQVSLPEPVGCIGLTEDPNVVLAALRRSVVLFDLNKGEVLRSDQHVITYVCRTSLYFRGV